VPTLAFCVVNTGAQDVARGDLAVNTNSIWTLCPDGTVNVRKIIADPQLRGASPPQDSRVPMIVPGERVVWELPVEYLIQANDRPGVYRVYWDFGGVLSDEIRLLRRPGLGLDGKPLPKGHPEPKATSRSLVESVKRFYVAMDGDPNGMTNGLWLDDTDARHREVARLLRRRAREASRFKTIVVRRFGEDALNLGWFYASSDAHTLRALEQATITYPEHFMEAYLEPNGGGGKLHLVRKDGAWMVSADNFLRGGELDPSLKQINAALERTADELERGMYPHIRDAREAMRLRIWENKEPPTTNELG
jgi:hypothetical protein